MKKERSKKRIHVSGVSVSQQFSIVLCLFNQNVLRDLDFCLQSVCCLSDFDFVCLDFVRSVSTHVTDLIHR